MTAVDRPDNGQDEGRELLDKAAGLVAHNVSPAIGWWRSADAKGEPFDRELLRERYERAARDVLALASGRAGAGEQQREQVVAVLRRHAIGAFAGGDVACSCDRTWRAGIDYRDHLADKLLSLLGGQPGGEAGRG